MQMSIVLNYFVIVIVPNSTITETPVPITLGHMCNLNRSLLHKVAQYEVQLQL
jgi:hypothetical protein